MRRLKSNNEKFFVSDIYSLIFVALLFLFPHSLEKLGVNLKYTIYFYDMVIVLYFLSLNNISKLQLFAKLRDLRMLLLWIIFIFFNAIYSFMFIENQFDVVMGMFRVYFLYSFYIIPFVSLSYRRSECLKKVIICCGVLISFYAILNLFTGNGYRNDLFLENSNDTIRYLSYIQATMIFLPLNIVLSDIVMMNKKLDLKVFFILIVCIIGIILSNYRTIWLNLAVTGMFYFLYNIKKINIKKILISLVIISLIIYFARTFYIDYILSKFNQYNLEGAVEGRTELWLGALKVFYENKLFGIGIGYRDPFAIMTIHNDHLMLLRDTGILGVVLFYVGIVMENAYKVKKCNIKYVVFWINIFITASLQPFLFQGCGYILFILTLAMMVVDTNKVHIN